MIPPDTTRPRPRRHTGNEANHQSSHRNSTATGLSKAIQDVSLGAVMGALLALLAVQWIDDSLGVEPGHVEHVAGVAR